MPELSQAFHHVSPPEIRVPRDYNAAYDLIQRNLRAGRADKTAFIDDSGSYTYADLAQRVGRCANALRALGILPEQRILICLHDDIDAPTVFLGCVLAGIVPVPVNTVLTSADYRFMLRDSGAVALVVSASLLPVFETALRDAPAQCRVIVTGEAPEGHRRLGSLLATADAQAQPAPTCCDDLCFWLYSSGSTGTPKGTVHVHSSLIRTAELDARPVLGLDENDVLFSAAKLYFAYGLGNALTFPLAAGATSILMSERSTPSAVCARLRRHRPTVFFCVPTLCASLLASQELPGREELRLRLCASAGEALPADIGRRWRERMGVDILDGIGSTEMLHIFLSNRQNDVHYGTTGRPVPGYEVRLCDEHGNPVANGELGELRVKGPTAAALYWNSRERSRATFCGEWTRSGDQYYVDSQGRYVHAGRSDDMLKVSGLYVSPMEIESVLLSHVAVLEAAVIGAADGDGLIKPMAFVVPRREHSPSPALREDLQRTVKTSLAPYKYPRWVVFVDELPKTATGKIQRYKLRERSLSMAVRE